ncbi:MAG: DUF6714 family protein [Deinococcaceae bacterium]
MPVEPDVFPREWINEGDFVTKLGGTASIIDVPMQVLRWDVFVLEVDMTQHRDLIEAILLAFLDVQKGSGIGLRKASFSVEDSTQAQVEIAHAWSRDVEQRWQDLPGDLIENCDSALSFMDPDGLRLWWGVMWTLLSCEPQEFAKELALDGRQVSAIAHYLKCITETDPDIHTRQNEKVWFWDVPAIAKSDRKYRPKEI